MQIRHVAALALLAVALQTLPAEAHGRKGQRGVSVEQLELSEEQLAQLEAIRTDFDARAQALREAHRADELAVLSEEQLAALTAYQDQRHRRGNRSLELGLSDDQISALNDLNATYREARASLQTAHREAVAALLTDEQRALLEALHSAPPFRGMHRGGHGRGDRADEGGRHSADESIAGLADAGTVDGQTGASSLLWSGAVELTTAVESASWGRIKSDLSE